VTVTALDSPPLAATNDERQFPPVTELAMVSLALVIAGGIYLSSHLPQQVPLTPAIILLVLSALVMAVNIALLVRVQGFPWDRFFAVAKWSALSYIVIAGLLLYVFLRNDVSGATLVILVLSLLVFAIHVPILMGFTVARYAEPSA
jgi:hypothetical protein